jgi:flavin reductase (DIM6/NTAB) family NADH-FMN oxidoreductase RutF
MKKSLGRKTIIYPHPVLMVGTYDVNGAPNIMVASWGGICCSDPPCVAISVRESRYTYNSILANKAFTVNIPSVSHIKEVDYAGMYSGSELNKFEKTGLTPVKSDLVKAPYVKEFPLTLICKLLKVVEIGAHTQFIGEIMDTIVDEEMIMASGQLDIEQIKPFIYDSSSRSYYAIGEKLMDAYSSL